MPLFMRGKSPEENEDVSLRLTNYFTYKNHEKEKNKQKKNQKIKKTNLKERKKGRRKEKASWQA